AQEARPVVRPALQRGRTEVLTQRGVDDVRCRMRLTRAEPPLLVDSCLDRRRRAQRPLEHADLVRDEPADRTLYVDHLRSAAVPYDRSAVGALAAGLGVERRAV